MAQRVASCNVTQTKSRKFSCSFGRYTGIFYSLLGGFWTVLWGALLKTLHQYTSSELTFYGFFFCASIILPFVVWSRPIIPKVRLRHVLLWISLSTLQVTSVICKTLSFQLLPLGEASSITFSTPLFTSIFARIILKERLTWMTVLSLIMSLVGMLLTMRVPEMIAFPELHEHLDSNQHLIGCTYALGCVITAAGMFIVVRSLKDIPAIVNTSIQSTFVAIFSACASGALGGFNHTSCDLVTSSSLIGLGALLMLLTVFVHLALQLEDATTMGTVYRATDIIIAFFIQVIFFQDPVDVYAISGAMLVFFSGFLMPLQRWMEAKPEGSCFRESWILK